MTEWIFKFCKLGLTDKSCDSVQTVMDIITLKLNQNIMLDKLSNEHHGLIPMQALR